MNKEISSIRKWRAAAGVALLLMLTSGCAPLMEKPASVEWHEVYRPINDAEATRFLHAGIELLRESHGAPVIPIEKVFLRHTVKNQAASHYRVATGFSKMEVVDRENGIFCIYLAAPPSHQRFYFLLGHEIGHLLRPDIIGSAEEERFCNEFSRQLCIREKRPWSAQWETRHWVREH